MSDTPRKLRFASHRQTAVHASMTPGEIFGSYDSIKHPMFLCLAETCGPLDDKSKRQLEDLIQKTTCCRQERPRPCLFLKDPRKYSKSGEKSGMDASIEICLLATFQKQPYNVLPDILKYFILPVAPNKNHISERPTVQIGKWQNPHSWLILWAYEGRSNELVEWDLRPDASRRSNVKAKDLQYLQKYEIQLRNSWQNHTRKTSTFRQLMFDDTTNYFDKIRKCNPSTFTVASVNTTASATQSKFATNSVLSLQPPRFGSETGDLDNKLSKSTSKISIKSGFFSVLELPTFPSVDATNLEHCSKNIDITKKSSSASLRMPSMFSPRTSATPVAAQA